MMNRLEKYRKIRRWSIQELAEKVGISVDSIYDYEHNIRIPRIDNMKKIAKAFDTEYDYIFPVKNKLKRYMKDKKLSVLKLSIEADVSPDNIRKIMNYKVLPQQETMEKLSKVFNEIQERIFYQWEE